MDIYRFFFNYDTLAQNDTSAWMTQRMRSWATRPLSLSWKNPQRDLWRAVVCRTDFALSPRILEVVTRRIDCATMELFAQLLAEATSWD